MDRVLHDKPTSEVINKYQKPSSICYNLLLWEVEVDGG